MNDRFDYNFDFMKDLAKSKPAEFIALRSVMLDQLINSLPNPDAAKQMQDEIDFERIKSAPGLKSCNAIFLEINEKVECMSLLADKLCALNK